MKVVIVNGRGASGKALCNSTIIPTPTGQIKVGEVKVGDYLFDRKGRPTKVLGVFPQGKKDVYKITFGDGRSVLCSIDHLWNVHKESWHREKSKNKFVTLSTEEILKQGIRKEQTDNHTPYNWSIQCHEPCHFDEKQYDIHPYVIGAFLGDGCCKERILTLSSNDIEIVNKINILLGNNGYKKFSKNNYNWSFKCKNYKNSNNVDVKYYQTKTLFKNYLNDICVYSYEKKVPEIYKFGSIEQRLQLLQGLMDTDGSIDKNGVCHFTSTSLQLIKDVQFILGTLGYVSIIHEDARENKYTSNCYNLSIKIPNEEKEKLFSLPRKRNIALSLKKSQKRYDRVKIVNIEKMNYKEEMTCFYVDNDEHLFLANDFIVTHNTTFETMVQKIAEARNLRVEIISTIDYVKKAAKSIGWSGSKTPADRRFLSDLKDALTRWDDVPYKKVQQWIEYYEKEFNGFKTDILFIDCREPEEIARFVEDYNALTVLVQRGKVVLLGNHADDNVENYQYDIVIDNSRGLDELLQEATIFVETFVEDSD